MRSYHEGNREVVEKPRRQWNKSQSQIRKKQAEEHTVNVLRYSTYMLHVPGWKHNMSNQQGRMMKDNYQRYERCLQYYVTKIIIRVSKIINYLFKFICVTRFTSKTHLCFILICLKYPILIEKTPRGAMGHHQPGLLMPAPRASPPAQAQDAHQAPGHQTQKGHSRARPHWMPPYL